MTLRSNDLESFASANSAIPALPFRSLVRRRAVRDTIYEIRYTLYMSAYYNDAIFWVEVDRIKPNPFQPRKVFDEASLASLADSIRSYGVLQPLTVTRKEIERPGEGIFVEYELIAGERRLRAAKLAG